MRSIWIICSFLVLVSSSKVDYWNVLLQDLMGNSNLKGEQIREHCGRSQYHPKYTFTKRIIGGAESRLAEWPWLVSLLLERSPAMEGVVHKRHKDETKESEGNDTKKEKIKRSHICGGVLISPSWVMTAAHCFERKWHKMLTNNSTKWIARVGEHNMKLDESYQLDISIAKIITHPSRPLRKRDHKNDIALLKLARPVPVSKHISLGCLPYPNDDFMAGDHCTAAGWGVTKEEGKTSEVPRHVEVPLISHDECVDTYMPISRLASVYEIVDTMLCAGDKAGVKDSCQFDSGGPLMCRSSKDGQWVVAGIISYGIGCARGWPGVYTRVTSYIDWIEKTVSSN